MTIATIAVSNLDGSICIVQERPTDTDPYDLLKMLDDAGLGTDTFIGCYAGYENCIWFYPDHERFSKIRNRSKTF